MNDSIHAIRENPDDLVNQAVAAITAESAADTLSPQVLANVLGMIRQRAATKPRPARQLIQTIVGNPFRKKLAIAALVIITCLSAFWMLPKLSSISYGDVAACLRAAHTMSWTESITGGDAGLALRMKIYFSETGQFRIEEPHNIVSIFDQAAGKDLTLDENARIAMLLTVTTTGPRPAALDETIDFRKLADQPGSPIEDRRIGNVLAKGFKVAMGDQNISLWVDPKTRLPILMEMKLLSAGQSVTAISSDITFDAPLDPSLFSLDIPSGYTLKQSEMSVSGDLETNALNILSPYSALSHGVFPPRLDDMAAFTEISFGSQEADEKVVNSAAALTGLMAAQTRGRDYDYLPANAKLGDADKIIFWYRVPGGSYRAIYGDLHAADVKPQDLRLQPSSP